MKTILVSLAISLISLFSAMGDDFQKGGDYTISLRIQQREADNGTKMPITKEQVDQAIQVIKKRLNSMGTVDPLIAPQGSGGIIVQMTEIDPEETARIRSTLEKVCKLELREVNPRSDEPGADGKSLAQRVQDGSEIVPGYRAYTLKGKDEHGNTYSRPILLNRRVALGGADIANAVASPQQAGAVAITLNGDGTAKMIALTKNMRPGRDRLAIMLDGEVISVPVLNQVPLGKHFIIEGLQEPGEAQDLANSLLNPLENPLKIEKFHAISPSGK